MKKIENTNFDLKLLSYKLSRLFFKGLFAEIIWFCFSLLFFGAILYPIVFEQENIWDDLILNIFSLLFSAFLALSYGSTLINRIKQEKIENSKQKKLYLKQKFEYLINTTGGVEGGEKIYDIIITKPIKKKGEWLVDSVTLDYDGAPNSKQVYFISDSELNKLIN